MLEQTHHEQLKHLLTKIHSQLFYLFRSQPTLIAHPQSYCLYLTLEHLSLVCTVKERALIRLLKSKRLLFVKHSKIHLDLG